MGVGRTSNVWPVLWLLIQPPWLSACHIFQQDLFIPCGSITAGMVRELVRESHWLSHQYTGSGKGHEKQISWCGVSELDSQLRQLYDGIGRFLLLM